ncbi:MAG: hypothetical protein LUF92_16590 [Clostridiales bacterium]|nr:hypothetical protein [Clostridiales bacterium]
MADDLKTAKHTAKDSVFADLFQDKKYLLQLYQALHPEDTKATEDSLMNVTIHNVLLNGQYNDLGFLVNNKLLILAEAQNTWTMNIIVRALLYLVQTIQEYLISEGADLYGSKKVPLPETELYVIFTGERVHKPDTVTLKEEFYKKKTSALDVTVKVLYGTVHPDKTKGEDIIGQYVAFTKVFNEQVHIIGWTREAVVETIRICKNRDILKDYLISREKEAMTIMLDILYDPDTILKNHIASEKKIAAEEAREEAREAAVRRMLRDGKLPHEDIALYEDVPVEKVREIEDKMLANV